MKTTAIYVRVSSKSQDIASQLPDLHQWEKAHGECVWFKDTFSGRSMDREGWNKLMDAVHAGKVNRIVVWRLDRLGRTAKGLTALFDDLYSRKIGLVSIKDGVDLSTAAGRLLANMLASVAQFETEIRGERVRAGQAAARAKGKKWGGSKPGRRLVVTDEQVETIRTMKGAGKRVSAIARATGLTRATVYSHIGTL